MTWERKCMFCIHTLTGNPREYTPTSTAVLRAFNRSARKRCWRASTSKQLIWVVCWTWRLSSSASVGLPASTSSLTYLCIEAIALALLASGGRMFLLCSATTSNALALTSLTSDRKVSTLSCIQKRHPLDRCFWQCTHSSEYHGYNDPPMKTKTLWAHQVMWCKFLTRNSRYSRSVLQLSMSGCPEMSQKWSLKSRSFWRGFNFWNTRKGLWHVRSWR